MFHQSLIWRLILVLCVARVARLQSTLNAESSDYDQHSNFLLELKELVDQLWSEMRRMSQENQRQPCLTVDMNHSTSLVTEFIRQGEKIKTELKQIKDLFQPLSQQLKQKVDNDSIDLTERQLAVCEEVVAEIRRQNDDIKTELQHVKNLIQSLTPQLELKGDNFSIELTEIPLAIDGMTSEHDGDDENVVTPAFSTGYLVENDDSPQLELKADNFSIKLTETPLVIDGMTSEDGDDENVVTPAFITDSTPVTPILAHTLHGTVGVQAIATLGDRLFVNRGGVQVSVYDTTSFQLQHQLNFSDLGHVVFSLAACSTHNYLYISSFWGNRMQRVGISSAGAIIGTRIKWDVMQPKGLSVNSACNVLVACGWPRYLVREYSPTGSVVREISDSNAFYQAVGLSNGMWAVSRFGPTHGITIVSFNGSTTHVEHSYEGEPDSRGGLRLTVDEHDYIIAADYDNHRLLVLNPTLTDVRQLPLPLGTNLRYPNTLALDQSRGRLYVGEAYGSYNRRLLVFNYVTNVGTLFNV